MKKILLLATTPFLNDGITKIEMDIIRYNKRKIDFTVASAFSFDNIYGKELSKNKINCYRLTSKNKVIQYMVDIYRLIKKEDYNAVYIHGNSAMMFIEALPVWLARKSRIITHCHNTSSNYPLMHKVFKPFFNQIISKKLACSKSAANWAYYGENIKVIVNGIDIEKFAYDAVKREIIRKELSWDDAFIIGHVGRFERQKNHSFLIDIFFEVQRQIPETRLLLIGSGELENKIKKQVADYELMDKVAFLGNVDCVSDYLQAMDILVLPSFFEGLCLVALEAQANGMPVLISDKMSKEIFATSCIAPLSLNAPIIEWVKHITDCKNKNRIYSQGILREKGYDLKRMMSEIQTILLEI